MLNNFIHFIPLLNGLLYVILWIFLFVVNLYLFDKFTPFSLKKDILETQSKALWHIVRGQILWQSIMIGILIYFLWGTYTKETFTFWILLYDILNLFYFWLIWIFLFQWVIFVIWKIIPLYKEIILEENISLWMIIEWLLIAMSIIISLSLYSY